jgi:anthranilate synthase component 1
VPLVTREFTGRRDLLALAAASPARYPCLFESVAHGPAQARYDLLLAFPQSSLTLGSDGVVRDGSGVEIGKDFLAAVDDAWRAERHDRTADEALPFRGGWALFLAYELVGQWEKRLQLPAAPEATPVAVALRCPAAVIVDHARNATVLVAEQGHFALLDAMLRDLDGEAAPAATTIALAGLDEDSPQRYLDGAQHVHDYLRAGDVFQVNLSREWVAHAATPLSPAQLYANLRHANPAPFAGLWQGEGWAVASSSPERLVEVRGCAVQTRPIAGTRPRFPGDDDAERIRELVGHPKERAEHVMLIDLERNDLGRVCVAGSVEVNELMSVESYAHVHHIVSNVRGRLRDSVSPGEILRAVFPGGTITGCPKVRCMQIIAELEQCGRGAYTGAMGYLNRDGDMDLNILIRTITQVGNRLRFRAGAGIVVDSDATRELEETRHKARGLLRALGADA